MAHDWLFIGFIRGVLKILRRVSSQFSDYKLFFYLQLEAMRHVPFVLELRFSHDYLARISLDVSMYNLGSSALHWFCGRWIVEKTEGQTSDFLSCSYELWSFQLRSPAQEAMFSEIESHFPEVSPMSGLEISLDKHQELNCDFHRQ